MLPVLAELQRGRGSKFVTLVNRVGASRKAVSESLAALVSLGLVMRNPGYGHPLRPEYLLTTRAMQAGPALLELYDLLTALALRDTTLKKWALAVLVKAAGEAGGARFSTIRSELPGITDRGLTLALKELRSAGLVTRLVLESYPPTVRYQASAGAGPIVRAVRGVMGEFPFPPGGAERRRRSLG